MAHPSSGGLRARVPASNSDDSRRLDIFADQTPLLDEEAVLSKHHMMEEKTLEIELEHIEVEKKGKERLCFRDGKRFIDYVIVYETPSNEDELKEEEKEKLREKAQKRDKFQQNLLDAGLEIEYEEEVTTKVGSGHKIIFVISNTFQCVDVNFHVYCIQKYVKKKPHTVLIFIFAFLGLKWKGKFSSIYVKLKHTVK